MGRAEFTDKGVSVATHQRALRCGVSRSSALQAKQTASASQTARTWRVEKLRKGGRDQGSNALPPRDTFARSVRTWGKRLEGCGGGRGGLSEMGNGELAGRAGGGSGSGGGGGVCLFPYFEFFVVVLWERIAKEQGEKGRKRDIVV